jgi:hypothetical protein
MAHRAIPCMVIALSTQTPSPYGGSTFGWRRQPRARSVLRNGIAKVRRMVIDCVRMVHKISRLILGFRVLADEPTGATIGLMFGTRS